MATTHVFIVDTITFKYHLEYLFVGTGASEKSINFLIEPNISIHHSIERNLVSMLADFSRVRQNDFVIFYLQQNFEQGIYEGKFYGIFRIKENNFFVDDIGKNQFLEKELKKSLVFRITIKPYKIYSQGVSDKFSKNKLHLN